MEILKTGYINNIPQKHCSFKGQSEPGKEISTEAKTGGSEALANYGKAQIALNSQSNPLDKYVLKNLNRQAAPHTLFYASKGAGTYLCRGTQSGIWKQFLSEDARKIPWKMHIYADNEADWQKLATILTRYLKNENCSWKTVSLGVGVEDLPKISEHQKGKAFTIYPTSTKQFAKIAHELDYIIKQSSLQLEDSEIAGDRALGNSGRIFYRYEYNTEAAKDLVLDLSNIEEESIYHELYRPNTDTASYLADDMTEADDIWLNFDPETDSEEFIQE